jgi:hypothetical protein
LTEYPTLREVIFEMCNGRASKGFKGDGIPGKGKERKGTGKGRGVGEGIPEDAEVLAWAAEWPGEPASGLDGPIPEAVVTAFLARVNGSSYGWPPNWQRALVADYRKARTGGQKKTGAAAVSESVRVIEERKETEALKRELAEIERQETEDRLACMPFNAERRARKKVLVAKLEEANQ